MVAEKTSKLAGNQFLKDTLHYMQKRNFNQRFKNKKDNKRKYGQQMQKSKKDNKRTLQFWNGTFFRIAPFPDVCLLLPFHALVDVYYVCVACLSLG